MGFIRGRSGKSGAATATIPSKPKTVTKPKFNLKRNSSPILISSDGESSDFDKMSDLEVDSAASGLKRKGKKNAKGPTSQKPRAKTAKGRKSHRDGGKELYGKDVLRGLLGHDIDFGDGGPADESSDDQTTLSFMRGFDLDSEEDIEKEDEGSEVSQDDEASLPPFWNGGSTSRVQKDSGKKRDHSASFELDLNQSNKRARYSTSSNNARHTSPTKFPASPAREQTQTQTQTHPGSEKESESDLPQGLSTLPAKAIPATAAEPNDPASETESESDTETQRQLARIASKPSTRPQPQSQSQSQHQSDTEDESDTEMQRWLAQSRKSLPKAQPNSQSSNPSSEIVPIDPEDKLDAKERKPPKPLHLKARNDQVACGPLILSDAQTIPREGEGMGRDWKEGKRVRVPTSVNTFLRPYQRDGVRFFFDRWIEGRGGILGDDMGLGKTIQVIAFLGAIMGKSNYRRDQRRRKNHVAELQDARKGAKLPPANETWPTALIVAPRSVVENWARELDTWGYFEYAIYGGKDRQTVLKDFKMGRLDIVIASHEMVSKHIADFDDLAWSCVFVDEVHKIKNPNSSITQAYNQFVCKVRFGLTGTALQNDYKELWPPLDWSNPGKLGSKAEWHRLINTPLKAGQSSTATEEKKALATLVAQRFVEQVLPLFFLRRTKSLIKDQLPRKYDKVVFCPLKPLQATVYRNFINTPDVQLMLRKDEMCDCGSKVKRGKCCYTTNASGDPWSSLMLKYISVFQQVSNHLLLIAPSNKLSDEQNDRNRKLMAVAFPEQPDMKIGAMMMRNDMCGKFNVLRSLLQSWKSEEGAKHKVLIFSKSVKLIEFLEHHLKLNFELRVLTGKTPGDTRQTLVDEFNNDDRVFVFLISTLAGGTGLNLTAANKVVIFDPNWNPAHDLQAMDRAYRYGQLRDVYVYRLLSSGTLEELVYARQIYKQQQMNIGYEARAQTRYFDGVQGDKEKQGELFGIKNIFTLHESPTKHSIEDAYAQELEWALANVPSDGKKGSLDDNMDVRAIGALLMDDDEVFGKVQVQPPNNDDLVLAQHGVQYTHLNDQILKSTEVAGKQAQDIVKGLKRKPSKKRRESEVVEATRPVFPPIRAKHRLGPSLESRMRALLESKMISNDTTDFARFAIEFAHKSEAQQKEILRVLDNR